MSNFIAKTIGPNSPLGRRASGIFASKKGVEGELDEGGERGEGKDSGGADREGEEGGEGGDDVTVLTGPPKVNRSVIDPSVIRPANVKTPFGETYSTQAFPATSPPANIFNLRVGPNYKRTGKKAPSGPELYKLDKCDLVQTSTSRLNVINGSEFQHFVPELSDKVLEGTKIPAQMIVTANLPTDSPSMFSTAENGPSFVVVFYFSASGMLVAEAEKVKNGSCVDPGVLLLNKWCSVAETDRKEMGRFKAMCIIDDMESHGFPGFISKFNGKPILINRSGTYNAYRVVSGGVSGGGEVELAPVEGDTTPTLGVMQVNVHVFAFVARKGLFSMQDKFKDMTLNVGFCIEGRCDEEQPEVILGCATLKEMDIEKMIKIDC
ncbi:hypothetical protein TrVE_jg13041 [Triparma verrucosa]|uniref:Protein ENHANCED DISEASE RESISTANCE 2 C-terminal domain-containing protein n=1 Tax=Triparma verrucosa TaxID=1606542 RepID=A0A9W7F874_9STRA|nr:hypothetical protein TrVE_jg13041 [Triparma verrucosa]